MTAASAFPTIQFGGNPPPDARGVIPNAASFPLDKLQPGQYELVVVAQQGGSASEERAVFIVGP